MKEIAKTTEIIAAMRRAIGSDASLDNLAVYEAIALNTRPLRKRHPLYNGAVAQRSLLLEMAVALEVESRPVQIMHNGDALPIGRIFMGKVIDDGLETELRALFWVDKTHTAEVAKINNGTIDQVSVGILPRQMICSADGFDFLGPDASFDNIWTGTTPDGHTVGKNGVYCRMVGLEAFFEISLVGQGGAQNARIVAPDQTKLGAQYQRLAASGAPLDKLVLTATAETDDPAMDIKELLGELRASEKENGKISVENVTLKAENTSLKDQVTSLTAKVAELGQGAPAIAEKQTQIETLTGEKTTLTASLSTAETALRGVLTKVLVASGQVDPTLPEKLEDVVAQIDAKSAELAAALTAGGKSKPADSGSGTDPKAGDFASAGFRTRR